MDLTAIRTALAATVETVTGVCHPHPVRSPNVPCGVIVPADGEFVDYLLVFKRANATVNLKILLLASLGDDEGTARMSSWLSTGVTDSVPDALVGTGADKTLGGLVQDLVVRRAENVGYIEIPPGSQTWFSSAEIAVDIMV